MIAKEEKKTLLGSALSLNMNAEPNAWILLATNNFTFAVVCCITASGFKVMLLSRLVEKARIQFDSCWKKKKYIYIYLPGAVQP